MAQAPRAGARVVPITAVANDAAGEIVSMFQAEAKIQSRAVSGRFATWRWTLVWLTQLVFYGLPWLTWNGRPAMLFDLGERRFYVFNLLLYPQDFIYLTALLVISAFGLFLFTAVAGRLWCGYTCPQTVYTEIFMWVEQRCEGDRNARLKLDAAGWSLKKLRQRGTKHVLWLLIGLWTGFTFVGYFTPIRDLWAATLGFALGPWELFWILFYGLATYGNAGFLREQVCKYMCPYARFQGVMFDPDTLVISYDPTRGEPRGSRPRSTAHAALPAAGQGDCIDCTLCVQVCPTGIDIREGLQIECIGCAACIDVCDSVMDKMDYPRGLIRYATQREMESGAREHLSLRHLLRPRVLIYGAILLAIGGAFVASLWLREPLRIDVVRDRGALARLVQDGRIENSYSVQLMNNTEAALPVSLGVRGIPGAEAQVRGALVLAPAESRWVPVAVQVPPEAAQTLGAGAHPIEFVVSLDPGRAPVVEKSTFVVPR